MTATRSRTLRFHVLPWVLGALVLRAMIPMGFMPASGTTLASVMCSPQGMSEQIQIPGAVPEMQCDYCLSPALAGIPAISSDASSARCAGSSHRPHESSVSRFALIRAQTARGPPA